jgi:hypothetical protein
MVWNGQRGQWHVLGWLAMQSGLGCEFSLVLQPVCVLVWCAVHVLLLLLLCLRLHVLWVCTMLAVLLLVHGEGEGKRRQPGS